MRKKIIAANWKMNLNWQEAHALFYEHVRSNMNVLMQNRLEVVIFPSSLYLASFSDMLLNPDKYRNPRTASVDNLQAILRGQTNIQTSVNKVLQIGVQNTHYEEGGAYTGEIALQQVKSIDGIKYVLVGHSERRQYFNETDQTVKLKVDACLKNGFTPIICVGEPLDIRNRQQEEAYVTNQIETSLFHLTDEQIQQCVIAYEPIWAIGTGNSATSQQAEQMHHTIRENIANHYSMDTAEQISILYGGSCTLENAKELFSCPNIDGGLVGGASLSRLSFMNIITICANF